MSTCCSAYSGVTRRSAVFCLSGQMIPASNSNRRIRSAISADRRLVSSCTRTKGCSAQNGSVRRGDGARGGRDHPESKLAGKAGLQCRDLLLESIVIGEDAPCPQYEPLTFRSETFELLPASDQRNLQLVFELADGFGQRRLGHVAGARGAGEVTLPGEGYEILELTDRMIYSTMPPESTHVVLIGTADHLVGDSALTCGFVVMQPVVPWARKNTRSESVHARRAGARPRGGASRWCSGRLNPRPVTVGVDNGWCHAIRGDRC